MRLLQITIAAIVLIGMGAFTVPGATADHGEEECRDPNAGPGSDDDPNDCTDTGEPTCGDDQPPAGNEDFASLDVGPVFVCEGEHYDGGDFADDGDHGSDDSTDVDPSDGDVSVLDPQATGDRDKDNSPSLLAPIQTRASVNEGETEAYVHIGVFTVGETMAGADADDDKATVVWWGKDNTDETVGQPVIAEAVSLADLTRGAPGGGDCSYDNYEDTRNEPDNPICTRDNTAISVVVTP